MAHAVVAVEGCGRLGLFHNLQVRGRRLNAGANPVVIHREATDAVGIYSAEVRRDDDVPADRRLVLGNAETTENVEDELLQVFQRVRFGLA
ncbi:MAG: hypothetical protein U5L98_08100 [Halomonas sp.]|nr:hypothetical protein [Halomonas sp.]MDZ7852594.1 hypothetical protein [Halomonas sp.]